MANFTPQEIEQFLQEFFDVVGARQYVGARYVPIFGRAGEDTIEWDAGAPYEPLTVVMHNGVSYVSRRYVPNGVQITDTDYWVMTYRFNAQVEQYRQEVLGFSDRIDGAYDAVEQLRSDVDDGYVPFPDATELPKYGEAGQVLSTLGGGATEWIDPVSPSDEQAEAIITAWLDEHPEATTTVQDGSITTAKLANGAVTNEKLAQSGGILTDVGNLLSMMGGAIVNTNKNYDPNNASVTGVSVSDAGQTIQFTLGSADSNRGVYSTGSNMYLAGHTYLIAFDAACTTGTVTLNTRGGQVTVNGSGHFMLRFTADSSTGNIFYTANSQFTAPCTVTISHYRAIDITATEPSVYAILHDLLGRDAAIGARIDQNVGRLDGIDSLIGGAQIGVSRNYDPNNANVTNVSVSDAGRTIQFTLAVSDPNIGIYSTGAPLYAVGQHYVLAFDIAASAPGSYYFNTRGGHISFVDSGRFALPVDPSEGLGNIFYLTGGSFTGPSTITITNLSVMQVTGSPTTLAPWMRDMQEDVNTLASHDGTITFDDVTGVYDGAYYRTFINSLTDIALFAIQTDTHYGISNAFPDAMTRVGELVTLTRLMATTRGRMPMVCNLGDLVNGFSSKGNQLLDIEAMVHAYLECDADYVQVCGNHDDNSWYDSLHGNTGREIVTPDQWNQLVSVPVTANGNVVTLPGVRYGLYEDRTNRVRYVYLDTQDIDYTLKNGDQQRYTGQNTYAVRQAQIDFLVNALTNLRSDYRLIILSHHSLDDVDSGEPVTNADLVRGVLEAFVGRTTFTGTGTTPDFEATVSVDFSTAQATLIGCFAGHNHADAMYTLNGITYVQTDNTTITDDTGRSNSDTTANVTDVVCVNFGLRRVTIKRFGYGSSRTFTY